MKTFSELLEAYNITLNKEPITDVAETIVEESSKTGNIKHIVFFGSKGSLGEPESEMFKDAMKKYPELKITYIFNMFTYFFDYEKQTLTINYIKENSSTKTSETIKFIDNINTIFVYKSIHPKMWNEYLYDFSLLLEKHSFLQLNPPHVSKYANDKFLSYQKLYEYNVKQPKTVIVEQLDIELMSDDDDVMAGGQETIFNKLGSIYNIDAKNADDIKDLSFVVKLLNGSHGIGVFLCDGTQIIDILSAAFALDEHLKLLVQAKEQTIDGDLRVHVLTYKNNQTVLAQMKRKKIKSDFRSNYSLGADIEEVELTDEQRDLAREVAKLSGLTWCAVDIMPIKNKDGENDNVIIEYNQNPGVEGISKVLGKNFFNILFDELFKNIEEYGI